MRHLLSLLLFIFVFGLFASLKINAQTSMPGANAPVAPEAARQRSPEVIREKARRGEAPLSRLHPEVNIGGARAHRLPALSAREREQLKTDPLRPAPLRVGHVRSFGQPLDGRRDASSWKLSEGKIVALRVAAEGSLRTRVHFTGFDLPAGARLFVYSAADPDEYHGPYENQGPNGDGGFWTPPVSGAEVMVEYFEPGISSSSDSRAPYRIDAVSHIYKDLRALSSPELLPCHRDVPTEWKEVARSVVLIEFANEKGEFVCSGTLLNSSRPRSQFDSYLLTANHCVSDSRTASTVTPYFLYESADGPVPPQTTTSATLLATGANGDYSLLRIGGLPPAGVRYSGWTAEPATDGTAVTSITHPDASWTRIAFGSLTAGDCPPDKPGGFCNQFLGVRWDSGIVEPGSSGGGLWVGPANDPKLVGLLSGGFSTCSVNGPEFYGRFDTFFPALRYHLTDQGCYFDLLDRTNFVGAPGGIGRARLRRSGGQDCTYNVSTTVPWIRILSGSTGDLNGNSFESTTVWKADPNPSTEPRQGLVLIAGQSVSVYQAGAPAACESAPITAGQTINGTLAPADCRSVYDPEAYADHFTFTTTSAKQVSISLSSNAFDTFLTVLGPDGSIIKVSDDENNGTNSRIPGASGYFLTLPGPGQYTIEVSSFEQVTTGPYALTLETKDCTFSISPTELHVNGDGEIVYLDVRANEGFFCGWLALSELSWVTPVPDLGGTRIQLQIDPNTGDVPRTGTINVAGVPVTIRQEIRCRYEVKAETLAAPARGGLINVVVKRLAGALCFWSAPSDDAWISSASVDRTDEGGLARLLIQPNWNLTPRSRTVFVANQPLTITQEASGAGCTVLPLERGVRTEGALQENSCRTGSFQSAGSNGGLPNRSQFYRVTGRAGEQVTIAMTSDEFPTALSIYDVDGVRISSSVSLIGVNQSLITQALTKDGTYTIEAASSYPNDFGAFTIEVTTQSNTSCAPWLSSFKRQLGTGGGAVTVDVLNSTGTGCEWKAVSPLSWATIDGPTQGTGSGQVKINVAANNGIARSGIITIAGLPLQVVQDGTGIVVVSSAGFDAALAPESLASVFGDHFSWRAEAARTNPPPTSLWSTTVIVKDSEGVERRAALLYTSRRQVNFQIPAGTKPGAAQIIVRNGEFAADYTGPNSTGTMMIAQVAPRIFTANSTGSGVPAAQILRVKANGQQIYEPVFEFDAAAGSFKPRAISFGGPGEELYLVLYATGLRNFSSAAAVKAMIGNLNGALTYAGPAPGYVGLDQVNVLLPGALSGVGDAAVTLTVDGQSSNMVTLKFAEGQSILMTEALEKSRR